MKEVTRSPRYGCRWNLDPTGRELILLAQEVTLGQKVLEEITALAYMSGADWILSIFARHVSLLLVRDLYIFPKRGSQSR